MEQRAARQSSPGVAIRHRRGAARPASAGDTARWSVLGAADADRRPTAAATAAGKLPPAVYLFIDIIDREHRSRELPCNPQFWQAVQQGCCRRWHAGCRTMRSRRARWLPGKASAVWPRCLPRCTFPTFGNALSLSGSFWWPERGNPHGWLLQALDHGGTSPAAAFLAGGRPA